jgi:hypothetical protein
MAMMQTLERKVKELEDRVGKLEARVFSSKERRKIGTSQLQLKDFDIPIDALSELQT